MRPLPAFLLIACGLLCLAGANGAWLQNDLSMPDPWQTLGLAFHYADPSQFIGEYKYARVPWMFFQWVSLKAFPFWTAHYVKQSVLYLGLAASAIFLGRTLSPRGWFAFSTMLVFFPLMHSTGGADYHNVMTAALWFTTLSLALRNHDRPSVDFLLGISIASLIVVNHFFIPHSLFAAAFFASRSRLLRASSGVFVGLLTFSLISYVCGRGLFFVAPLISTMRLSTENPAYRAMWATTYSWDVVKQWYWVWFALFFNLIAAIALFRSASRSPVERRLLLLPLLLSLLWVLFQSAGLHVLSWEVHSFAVVLPATIASALVARPDLKIESLQGAALFVAVTTAALALSNFLLPLILLLFASLSFSLLRSKTSSRVALVTCAWIAVAVLAARSKSFDVGEGSRSLYAFSTCRELSLVNHEAVNEFEYLESHVGTTTPITAWVDKTEPVYVSDGRCQVKSFVYLVTSQGLGMRPGVITLESSEFNFGTTLKEFMSQDALPKLQPLLIYTSDAHTANVERIVGQFHFVRKPYQSPLEKDGVKALLFEPDPLIR